MEVARLAALPDRLGRVLRPDDMRRQDSDASRANWASSAGEERNSRLAFWGGLLALRPASCQLFAPHQGCRLLVPVW